MLKGVAVGLVVNVPVPLALNVNVNPSDRLHVPIGDGWFAAGLNPEADGCCVGCDGWVVVGAVGVVAAAVTVTGNVAVFPL